MNYPLFIPPSCHDVARLIASLRSEAAVHLLAELSLKDDKAAAALLAYIHLRGAALRADARNAYQQCALAAEQGDSYAQFVVALYQLAAGKTVEGMNWLKASCDQSFAPALSHMGRLLSTGSGLPEPDRKAAIGMFKRAIARRHIPAFAFLAQHCMSSHNPVAWLAGLLIAPLTFLVGALVFQFSPFRLEIFAHISSDQPPLFKSESKT